METRETIAQTLSRRGYATAGFTPNPFTSRYFGFDRGFDRFEDFMGSFARRRYGRVLHRFFEGSALASLARVGFNLWHREEAFKPWPDYYEDVLAWVDSVDEPYFCWVHLMDSHVPYRPPAAFRTQSRRATYAANYRFWRGDNESPFDESVRDRLVTAYDDTIRYVDAFLARVRRDLDDAVVVVHGDHGEAFGEHGTYGHESSLYEENVHVPLVVHAPGTDGLYLRDRTVSDPVSLRCLPSLLAGASDGSVPASGKSYVVSRTRSGGKTALRGRRLKYIEDGSTVELYDLARGEQTRLSNEPVREALRHWRRRVAAGDRERRAIRAGAAAIDDRGRRSTRAAVGSGGVDAR